jgi:hypothetical protein
MPLVKWVRNIYNPNKSGPTILERPGGAFAAGATNEVTAGDFLSIDGGVFVPQAADAAMTAELAVAHESILPGDRAGRYPIVVPCDGDVFVAELATAGSPSPGADVYLSGTQNKVALSGSNAIGKVVDHSGIPARQGHTASDASGDSGNTITNAGMVEFTILKAASYAAALQG